ncbi:hypothetical protein AGMMS50239_04660 [Bacteroidia bacterium]|nr:hypothetical protein AGMMS50239_04660 [Bacteroidia bacterium]
MKRYFLSITAIAFLVLSCSKTKQGDLLEIPIDIHQNSSLPLSEITDEIKAIELELTDKSTINTDAFGRVLIYNDYIVVLNDYGKEIILFDGNGRFIRQIGSRGQGPGEFIRVHGITADIQNERIFVSTYKKIICYDFESHLINEFYLPQLESPSSKYLDYLNNELILICDYLQEQDNDGMYSHSVLYKLNNNFQIKDSINIGKAYQDKGSVFFHFCTDFTTTDGDRTYLYYSELGPKSLLCDTLYSIKDNRLIPELKLKFKDEKVFITDFDKHLYIESIYKSSRYIFSTYVHDRMFYHFCYDTKTKKGYNMKFYTDDIQRIKKKIFLHPVSADAEKFYYLHTNMDKAAGLEEPNPTLYIGKLKK